MSGCGGRCDVVATAFLPPATTSDVVNPPFGGEIGLFKAVTTPAAFNPSFPLAVPGVFGVLRPKEPKAPPMPRLKAAEADLVVVGEGKAGLEVFMV